MPTITRCSCGAAWYGEDVCHCGGCHGTFATVELFELHRQPTRTRGLCKRPDEVGLVRSGSVWKLPPVTAADADRLARYRALRAHAAAGE